MVGLGSILFQCVSDLSFLFLSDLFFDLNLCCVMWALWRLWVDILFKQVGCGKILLSIFMTYAMSQRVEQIYSRVNIRLGCGVKSVSYVSQ